MNESTETSLHFHGLSERDYGGSFRMISRVLRREGREIVDRFYDRVTAHAEARNYFRDPARIDAAKRTQLEHWEQLFSQPIGPEYLERAQRIGGVHARIGLEPSLYFGGYAFILGELIERQSRGGLFGWLPFARRRARANAALVRAALFDMNIAITTVLNSTLDEVAAVTMHLDGPAHQLTGSSRDLAERTEQQASDLTRTVEAMQESEKQGAAARETSLAMNAEFGVTRTEAQGCVRIVGETVAAMSKIEESSKQISHITDLIDGIAFQTNLLALNAGVEAARAGEAGKGFAVVASEVRALAQRSADAARDIKGLIDASTTQVSTGAALVAQTGAAARAIVAKMDSVLAMINSITAHRDSQGKALDEVSRAVARIEGTTLQNAAMAQEVTAVATTLADKTGTLARLVGKFKKTGQADYQPQVPAPPAVSGERLAA